MLLNLCCIFSCVHVRACKELECLLTLFTRHSGRIWEPPYCDDLWWVSDGFPLNPARPSTCMVHECTRSFMQNYTRLHTIAISCLLHLIMHVYTVIICHHSLPGMMRILILCVCAGLVAGKTAKPFDTDLHWSEDVWRFPWLLLFFLDCVWLLFDMYKPLLDKASNWFLHATALPWVYPP